MASAVAPRVRMMAVCNGVRESATESMVFDLKGVRQGLVASVFPFAPRRLWLFALLASPRLGEYPGYVRILNDKTEKAIFYWHMEPRPTFDATGIAPIRARITCSFPEEGWYTVQICFFQDQGSDVVKGEIPFFVALEGT